LHSVLRNEEIVKRDDLILRLSTLEKDVETYAETVQGYEKLILSLEEEKSTLLASMGDREDDIKNIFELKRQLDEFSSIAEERDTLKAEIDRLRSNGESVSDLQGRLLEAENTIQELDSIFIQFHEEQKKNKEYQAAISDLMNRLQDLEKELIVKNEQILSQEMRLDGEKSRSQEMEYSPSRSRKKSGYVFTFFLIQSFLFKNSIFDFIAAQFRRRVGKSSKGCTRRTCIKVGGGTAK
jgi:predicted  nucleic acid-binding Zn-ribbon protein